MRVKNIFNGGKAFCAVLTCLIWCNECAAKELSTNELAALVAADLSHSVRPGGGVHDRVFWNRNSLNFMYPPAFDFSFVEGAKTYRFTVTDGNLDEHVFTAAQPSSDLSPVWSADGKHIQMFSGFAQSIAPFGKIQLREILRVEYAHFIIA